MATPYKGGGEIRNKVPGAKIYQIGPGFLQNVHALVVWEKYFFFGFDSLFLGVRETFFRGVLRFSKIVVHFPKLWFNRGPGGNHHPTQQGIRKFIMKHRYSFLLAFGEYLERRID